jgi:hypothetical protein
MYRPLKLSYYLKWISKFGWSLRKVKIDWLLLDDDGHFVCTIKIQHPGPREVVAHSVKKTEAMVRERDLI